MKAIFKGSKFVIQWSVTDAVTSLPFDFTGLFVDVVLYSASYNNRVSGCTISGNKIQAEIPANMLPVGVYSILCDYRSSNDRRGHCVCRNAFQITRNPEFCTGDDKVVVESFAAPLQLEDMNINYVGMFTSADLLPDQSAPAWALVGDIKSAKPYFFYTAGNVPPGCKDGWNDMSAVLGTYDLTADKVSIYDFTHITEYNVSNHHSHRTRVFSPAWEEIIYCERFPEYVDAKQYCVRSCVNMPGYTASSFRSLKMVQGEAPFTVEESNAFTFEEAIALVPEDIRIPGLRVTFVSSLTGKAETWFFQGGDIALWKDKDSWKQINLDAEENTLDSREAFRIAFMYPDLVADRAIKDEFGNNIADTYLQRDVVVNYMKSVYSEMFIENPPAIMDGYITPDMLSESVKDLIGGSSSTIIPDEEDLTTIHGVTKFANKRYNPNTCSGKGRQYLRKNMVMGRNILKQSMMCWENTIYIIQYDYDLRGKEITIPEKCILQFEGGSFSNGRCLSNNTIVIGSTESSTALYGVFYDSNGQPLGFDRHRFDRLSYGLEHAFVNSGGAREARTSYYIPESLVVTSDYVFNIGTYGDNIGTVCLYDKFYNYLGQAIIPEFGHANGATIYNNYIYVACNLPDQTVAYLPIDDVVSACLNNSTVSASTITVNTLTQSFAIDYDEISNTFAILNRLSNGHNVLQIYDVDFNLLYNYDNDLNDDVYYSYLGSDNVKSSGTFADIIYKGGVVIASYWRSDGSSNSIKQTCCYVMIDATTGKCVKYLGQIKGMTTRCEPEGLCKYGNDFYISFLTKIHNSNFNTWLLGCYNAKISFETEVSNFGSPASDLINVPAFAQKKTNNTVYVNNTYTGYSTGNSMYPYKSITTALLMSSTSPLLLLNLVATDKEYVVGSVEFYNTELQIATSSSNGTKAKVRGYWYFYNCVVYFGNINFVLVHSLNESVIGMKGSHTTFEFDTVDFTTTQKDETNEDTLISATNNSTVSLRNKCTMTDIPIGIKLNSGSSIYRIDDLQATNVFRVMQLTESNIRVDGVAIGNITLADGLGRKFTFPSLNSCFGKIDYYPSPSIHDTDKLLEDLDKYSDYDVGENLNIFIKLAGAYKVPRGIFCYNKAKRKLRSVIYDARSTGNRPDIVSAGHMLFDTTLNKPIWWNGTAWVDADGLITIDNTSIYGKKVSFIGDSITYGYGASDRSSTSYVQMFKKLTGCTVNNLGVSSTCIASNTTNGLTAQRFVTRATTANIGDSDLIVVFGGINDFDFDSKPIGELFVETTVTAAGNKGNKVLSAPTDTDAFGGALHELITTIRTNAPQKPIMFVTPLRKGTFNPNNPNSLQSNKNGDFYSDFVNAIKEVCAFYSIPVLDLSTMSQLDFANSSISNKYSSDNLHPNDAGHRVIANLLVKFINNNIIL